MSENPGDYDQLDQLAQTAQDLANYEGEQLSEIGGIFDAIGDFLRALMGGRDDPV
jgi:hypothetical protein